MSADIVNEKSQPLNAWTFVYPYQTGPQIEPSPAQEMGGEFWLQDAVCNVTTVEQQILAELRTITALLRELLVK